ncbi:MAG: SRPBCC family protein [Gaiellaceae bacterium]
MSRKLLGWSALVHAVALAGVALRRLGRRSGATSEEVHARLPGDEIVRDPLWVSTRAISVEAAPSAIWPWIVQMGFPAYRGGWYTPYWLDRLQWGIRARSAEEIRPDLQDLEVGDRVPDSIDWSAYFTVAEIEPGRALVLHSTRHLLEPMRSIDFSWAFVLEPRSAGETRLVMRARARCEPRYAWTLLGPLIGLGDFVNASVMLRGIRSRVEREGHGEPGSKRRT